MDITAVCLAVAEVESSVRLDEELMDSPRWMPPISVRGLFGVETGRTRRLPVRDPGR